MPKLAMTSFHAYLSPAFPFKQRQHPFSARSRAHEYGGGAFTVADGEIYFSNDDDRRLYRLTPGGVPQAITAAADRRYADVVIDRRMNRILCVCEDHGAGAVAVNTIMAVDLGGTGQTRILVSGHDFFASPRLSPDGLQLAWLAWDHPDMPWDGSECWLADIGPDGMLENQRCVAGSREESIFQPAFSPDGRLYFVSDRGNWWNLYRLRDGNVEALAPMPAEFGLPQWVFGQSTYAFESAKRMLCAYSRAGTWQLAVLDLETLRLDTVTTPFTDFHAVTAAHGQAVVIAASPLMLPAVVRIDLASQQHEVLRPCSRWVPEADYTSVPRAISYPSDNGEQAHGFYYSPVNRDYRAPAESKPPLLVLGHGGPTASASSALSLKIQYWTSRGFAVIDVNYRGSTGYGRDYRHKLDGMWGLADVQDCIAGARYLVTQGLVDEQRLLIRGGSAGGYTTLCALTFHKTFCAGAVYYGVSDLEALAEDTHKFEAHYLDRLIGPYPARRDLYQDRSPLRHVDRMSCPVIFFQGLEDKVALISPIRKDLHVIRCISI